MVVSYKDQPFADRRSEFTHIGAFGMTLPSQIFAGRHVVLVAVGVCALGVGSIVLPRYTHANSVLSPIDRLVSEDEIRQKLALYGLLADGDGENKGDVRALAQNVLAPDVSTDLFFPDGSLQMHTTGRDEVIKATPPKPENLPLAGRHYMVATYFDEISSTAAKTRTTMFWLQVSKNRGGADCQKAGDDACGGRVLKAMTTVYHNEWVKTAEGWRMSRNVIRRDD